MRDHAAMSATTIPIAEVGDGGAQMRERPGSIPTTRGSPGATCADPGHEAAAPGGRGSCQSRLGHTQRHMGLSHSPNPLRCRRPGGRRPRGVA